MGADKHNELSLLKLYLIFVKIGAILLGGGYVILPILTSELCKKRELITEAELVEYFALSQSLPGIIATNISIFTGYKLHGKSGAVMAVFGLITVPFITITVLASVFSLLIDNKYINGLFWGVEIAVIALIILTVREIWRKSDRDWFFYLIFTLSLVALTYFKLSPVCVILLSAAFGVLTKRFIAGRTK